MITKRMTFMMSRGVPGARMEGEEVEQLPLNNGRPQGDDQHDNEDGHHDHGYVRMVIMIMNI